MFIWKKELELGITSIDNQHKKLLGIGNKVNDILTYHTDSTDNYDEIIEVVRELKEYTVYHFKTEEDLLIKYNYPTYDLHKKEHDSFIEYINSFDLSAVDENQALFLKELLNKIVGWIINHIITVDYMYKEFLITLAEK